MDEIKQNKTNGKMMGGMNNGEYNHAMCNNGLCWNGHRFSVLRFVLLLLLVSFIFSVGVKFGELKGRIEDGYGRGDMNRQWDMQEYRKGYMMPYGQTMQNNGMMNQNMVPTQNVMPAPGMMNSSSTL